MNDFDQRVSEQGDGTSYAIELAALVVSVTLSCNQSCVHCHVGSSPLRSENMSAELMAQVIDIASSVRPTVVDITGGAPELNPDLPHFLRSLRAAGNRVQLRTNLTVLNSPEYAGFPDLYAAEGIEILASMPCYTDRNVRVVRGAGVRDASLQALRTLNALGYGVQDGLRLDLVYNPVGTTLPEPQASLEALFRDEMEERFGIVFTRLLTMTNMPVGRFCDHLVAEHGYDRYLRALQQAFNPDVIPLLQCRHQVEIGWDGRLYDCDFNLGAETPVSADAPQTVWEFDADALAHRSVVHADHCFGCTAGAGSG